MQLNISKKEMGKMIFSFFFIVCLFHKSLSQKQTEFSCPMYKGIILIDKSFEIFGGKFISQAEIKSKKQDVYSVSPGFVIAIDTVATHRICLGIEYEQYVFIYDNLLSTGFFTGQKVEKGMALGTVEKGNNLLLRISDNSQGKYVDAEKILPCKVVILKN